MQFRASHQTARCAIPVSFLLPVQDSNSACDGPIGTDMWFTVSICSHHTLKPHNGCLEPSNTCRLFVRPSARWPNGFILSYTRPWQRGHFISVYVCIRLFRHRSQIEFHVNCISGRLRRNLNEAVVDVAVCCETPKCYCFLARWILYCCQAELESEFY